MLGKQIVLLVLALLAGGAFASAGDTAVLPTAEDTNITAQALRHRLADPDALGLPFTVSGIVIATHRTSLPRFILEDESGTVTLSYHRANVLPSIRIGDHITASGTITLKEDIPWPIFSRYDVIGHGPPPVPRRVSASCLNEGTCDERLVEISGILRDVFRDELDPDWVYFVLFDKGQYLYAALLHDGPTAVFEQEIGLRVSISGICRFRSGPQRLRVERLIWLSSKDNFRPADDGTTPADDGIPDIDSIYSLPASEIFELGRHCAKGLVLASWQENQSLIKPRSGRIVRLDVSSGSLPVAGDVIEAVGLPVPDLSQINLTHVKWTKRGTEPLPPSPVIDLNADEMFRSKPGHFKGTEHLADRGAGTHHEDPRQARRRQPHRGHQHRPPQAPAEDLNRRQTGDCQSLGAASPATSFPLVVR